MDHSIWSGSCNSVRNVCERPSFDRLLTLMQWYTTGGHNSTTYPWSQAHLWWRAKHPTMRDWALA